MDGVFDDWADLSLDILLIIIKNTMADVLPSVDLKLLQKNTTAALSTLLQRENKLRLFLEFFIM